MKKLSILILGLLMLSVSADKLTLSEVINSVESASCGQAISDITRYVHTDSYSYTMYINLTETALKNCESKSSSLPSKVKIARKAMIETCESKQCPEIRDTVGGSTSYYECVDSIRECKVEVESVASMLGLI